MRESEAQISDCTAKWQFGRIFMGGNASAGSPDPSYPTWCGDNGLYAFRHTMSSNFLHIDGHVAVRNPGDEADIDILERYEIDP